ncbi:uncharacterized protein K452DRAFT_204832, partial [Aplosporella prunicola CBS 121167]
LSFFLRKAADPKLKDSRGRTALHMAASESNSHAIKLLINAGADVNARTSKETGMEAPIHLAMFAKDPVVCYLLELGASVDARNNAGETALHMAAWRGNFEATTVLLSYGAG